MQTKAVWKDGMTFEVQLDGHHIVIDAMPEHGGRDLGPRPKGLTVSSLVGCTGMDVISILNKMRQEVTAFEVAGEAQLADEHPKRFTAIKVIYRVEGEINSEKLKHAVELSEDRYCGVSATLRPSVELTSEIWLNGQRLVD